MALKKAWSGASRQALCMNAAAATTIVQAQAGPRHRIIAALKESPGPFHPLARTAAHPLALRVLFAYMTRP
jgi:hypothetical protein